MSQKKDASTDFDFSELFELLARAKRQCWNYDRSQERFKKQLVRQHNAYFAKQFKPGSKSAVADKKFKKIATDNLIQDEDERALEDALGMGDDSRSDNSLQQVLSNPILIALLEDMRRKNKAAEEESGQEAKKKPVASPLKKDREKVPVDWFKNHMISSEHDEEKQIALEGQMKHYRELQTKVDLFFNEKLEKPGDGKGLSYYQYVSLLNEPDVSERIALTLMDKFDYLKKTSIKELATYVKKADKDLALKLKDGTITLDQLKARIAERKTGLKYVVLDDLKDILDPKFYAEVYQEESKNVQKQRGDGLNIRQNYNNRTQSFKAVPRDKGVRHQNYQNLPESIGKVDYNPKEVCPRVPTIQKKSIKDQIKIPIPREDTKPQVQIQNARVDPAHEKKQANIARLKKQLGVHLKELRMIELKEMPFDSSKVKFHDKMDMFFRLNEAEKPQRTSPSPSKKRPATQEKKPDKVNDYINAYEQRKREQCERRMQLLFLKRLENDGVKIIISKQDRELLRNFGKIEDEHAERDLQAAMESDGLATLKADLDENNTSMRQSRTTLNTRSNAQKSATSVGKSVGRFSMLKKVSAALAQSEAPQPEIQPEKIQAPLVKVTSRQNGITKQIDSKSGQGSGPIQVIQAPIPQEIDYLSMSLKNATLQQQDLDALKMMQESNRQEQPPVFSTVDVSKPEFLRTGIPTRLEIDEQPTLIQTEVKLDSLGFIKDTVTVDDYNHTGTSSAVKISNGGRISRSAAAGAKRNKFNPMAADIQSQSQNQVRFMQETGIDESMSPRNFIQEFNASGHEGSQEGIQESRAWQLKQAPKPGLSEEFKNFASTHGIPFVERPKIDTFSFDSSSTKIQTIKDKFKKNDAISPQEQTLSVYDPLSVHSRYNIQSMTKPRSKKTDRGSHISRSMAGGKFMVTNLNSRANINTTQHRLKTALAKNKARKQDFNTRFQGTSDAEPTSSWKNELIKGHCKISNDYKSLAA